MTNDPAISRTSESPPQGFRFSLRALAIFIAIVSFFFAACTQLGALGLVLAIIGCGLFLFLQGVTRKQGDLKLCGIALVVVGFLFLPSTFLGFMFRDKGPQAITDEAHWPENLQECVKVAGLEKKSVKAARGDGWDDRSFWRVDATQAQVDAIVAHFNLEPASIPPPRIWEAFPAEWRPIDYQGVEYYRSITYGSKSDNYYFIYDPQAHWLFVHYWFNF